MQAAYPGYVELEQVSDISDGGGHQQLLPCHQLGVGEVYQGLQGTEHAVLATIRLEIKDRLIFL